MHANDDKENMNANVQIKRTCQRKCSDKENMYANIQIKRACTLMFR